MGEFGSIKYPSADAFAPRDNCNKFDSIFNHRPDEVWKQMLAMKDEA